MFRSVFTRMLVTNLAITAIILVLLAIGLSFTLRGVIVDKQLGQMEGDVDNITALFSQFSDDEVSTGLVKQEIMTIAQTKNAEIWLVFPDGRYIPITGPNSNLNYQPFALGDQLNKQVYNLLNGVVPEIATTGMFDMPLNAPVMTVGKPINSHGFIIGAVLMHVKVDELGGVLRSTYEYIAFSALLAVGIAFILVYISSRRLSKPLHQMSEAASDIAKGNFERRVSVSGEDEIGQLSRSFNKMVMDLQTQENMRRGFVANVTHELRSPLTSIQGFAQGMLDGTVPENEKPKCYDTIVHEAKRLGKLINDLLDLSQMEAGKYRLNKTVIELNEIVRRTLITFEGKIDAKNLQVDVCFETEKIYVEADADRIIQVLTNLFDNAVKFSQQGGRLILRTKSKESNVRIIIADNGQGIPQKDLPYIWDRFYQAQDTARGGSGTGLGLPITKMIIEQHGGRIRVRSLEGRMTVFVIDLPAHKSN